MSSGDENSSLQESIPIRSITSFEESAASLEQFRDQAIAAIRSTQRLRGEL